MKSDKSKAVSHKPLAYGLRLKARRKHGEHKQQQTRRLQRHSADRNIHLGNYLGAVRQWVARQDEKVNYFCIVDLHSLTVPQDPAELRFQTRSLAAILMAAGLDPARSTIFIQSHVTAHAEACWLLNCITPLGWLQRMTQFKDKAAKQESVLTGLLDYPVLMAGDILLYDAHEVPVGEDQKQHVELARDIARRYNSLYEEEFFVVPEPVIPEAGARNGSGRSPRQDVQSLAHVRGHAVRLLDEPDEIMRSFRRAVTDSGRKSSSPMTRRRPASITY